MRSSMFAVCLLAACGDDSLRPHAAPGDSSTVDEMQLPVTLTVTSGGSPVPGVAVYFQNPDSSLVLATVTDARGIASANVATGGFVTAVNRSRTSENGDDEVETFAGVKPGDELVLREAALLTSVMVHVTSSADPDPGVVRYQLKSPCGSAQSDGAPIAGKVTFANCGVTDILVLSLDASHDIVSWFFVDNVALSDGMSLDLTGHAYHPSERRTYGFANVPERVSRVGVYDHLISSRGRMITLAPGPTDGTTQERLPAFPGATSLVGASTYSSVFRHNFVDWGPYASTYSTDVGARMLRDIRQVPTIDTGANSLDWIEPSAGLVPDFVRAHVQLTDSVASRVWTWNIVAPYTEGTVQFPTPPPGLAAFAFSEGDQRTISYLVAARVPGGYDAVRATAHLPLVGPVFANLFTTPSGSLTSIDLAPR